MFSFRRDLMGLIDMIDTQTVTLCSLMYVSLSLLLCFCLCFSAFPLFSFDIVLVWKQINMKGLDGIQGPIYVGTGCVFRRQALYGFDAPKKKKPPGKTCNCWPKWCCLCCGLRKKSKTKAKDKKTNTKETSKQIHALENVNEGVIVPGKKRRKKKTFLIWFLSC